MIPFHCPHCGFSTKVSPEFAGRTGPCQKCGQPVTVPPLSGGGTLPPPSRGGGSAMWIVLAVVLIGLLCVLPIAGVGLGLAAVAVPAVGQARSAARQAQSMNNLKQIGLALHNYHDTYGSFPPAYVTDANGAPLYSWRVLILPFIEQAALHQSFDKNASWESPQNAPLTNMAVPTFVAPGDAEVSTTMSSYVMPMGPNLISDGANGSKMMNITDGTSNTILAIDAGYPVAPWAAPVDLNLSPGAYSIGDGGTIRPRDGKVLVLFADGSVQALDVGAVSPDQLQSMLTRDGGEVVNRY